MRALLAALTCCLAACAAPGEWLTRGEEIPVVCAKVVIPAHEVIGHYECVDGVWQRHAVIHGASYLLEVEASHYRRLVSVSKKTYDRLSSGDLFTGDFD